MNTIARRDIVFLILAAIFITDALLGELTGGKLIQVGPFVMSIGILPWPVVLIATDLVNEYFGKAGVRRLTLVTVALIIFAFVVVFTAIAIPAASFSPVSDAAFQTVFGQSLWIIVGSVIAFSLSQLVDVVVFWQLRRRTGHRMLWLRASGSTAVSQLIDSFVITGIAFWLPGKLSTAQFLNMAASNYSYKLIIAVGITPLIYLAHALIDRFLGKTTSHELIAASARAANATEPTAPLPLI